MYNVKNQSKIDQIQVEKGDRPQMGLFITFEGIDGSGKSTQARHLIKYLEDQGISVLALREPGGTAIGESIRQILLAKSNSAMSMETELLLFAAARAQLVRQVIIPALADGQWVVCDRFYDSTTAYQGYGRGLDLDMIRSLNQIATGGCRPDRTFLFDISVEAAVGRLSGRTGKADRLDGEDRDFMERTRQGYLALAAAEPARFVLINADTGEAVLQQQIQSEIKGDIGNETDYFHRT
jgi:dTMP kinase